MILWHTSGKNSDRWIPHIQCFWSWHSKRRFLHRPSGSVWHWPQTLFQNSEENYIRNIHSHESTSIFCTDIGSTRFDSCTLHKSVQLSNPVEHLQYRTNSTSESVYSLCTRTGNFSGFYSLFVEIVRPPGSTENAVPIYSNYGLKSNWRIWTSYELYSELQVGWRLKRLCSVVLSAELDWCASHLCSAALVEFFGSSPNAANCENTKFRGLLKKVKGILEHTYKRKKILAKFEDLQASERKNVLKSISDIPQRWLSTIRLTERFLMLWSVFRKHHYVDEHKQFSSDSDHELLLQLFSFMRPIGDLVQL